MSPTVKAIAYGVVSLAAFILFAVGLNNALNGAPGGYHTKSDAPTLADALAEWLRERATALSTSLRWKLWGLLTRSRRVCPANAHGALIWRTRPVREILVDDGCRTDAALNGACWCGNLRDDTMLREPAAASAPGEGTAPSTPGAVPLLDRGPDHPPWITAGQPRLPEMLP